MSAFLFNELLDLYDVSVLVTVKIMIQNPFLQRLMLNKKWNKFTIVSLLLNIVLIMYIYLISFPLVYSDGKQPKYFLKLVAK